MKQRSVLAAAAIALVVHLPVTAHAQAIPHDDPQASVSIRAGWVDVVPSRGGLALMNVSPSAGPSTATYFTPTPAAIRLSQGAKTAIIVTAIVVGALVIVGVVAFGTPGKHL